MKRLIVCPVMLAVIIYICYMSISVTNARCGELVGMTERIKTLAQEERYDDAYDEYTKLSEQWEETEGIFALYMRHNDYDPLVESIAELGAFVRHRELPELAAECEAITAQLHHLNESQQITLENVI